jgi:catechol-2,3-dioxygenase
MSLFRVVLVLSSMMGVRALSMSARASQTAKSATASLSGKVLKDVVVDAARQADQDNSLDLNGIMWMEHINLVVGNKAMAEQFYFDFLGFTKDAGGSFHANLGQQQLHLAENGDPPQRVTGSIGLTVPSLDTIRARASKAEAAFQKSKFQVLEDNEECLTLTCPWGNRLHLYDMRQDSKVSLGSDSESPHKMVNLHKEGGSYGPHRMSVRGNPGIRYVEIACSPGTISAVQEFYQTILGCRVSTPSSSATCDKQTVAVDVGPGVHLVYVEDENLTDDAMSDMKGVHICIYANNFKGLYDKLTEKKLIWTNPRFTRLDCCDTWEEAAASRTLRFKDIIDVNTGQKVMELEHETRPLRHGQYLKVPNFDPK